VVSRYCSIIQGIAVKSFSSSSKAHSFSSD
jgi:hypothetical protein